MKYFSYILLIGLALIISSCESDYDPPHEENGTRFAPFVRWDTETGNIDFVMDLTAEDNPIFSAPITAPGNNVSSYDLSFTLETVDGTLGPWDLMSVTSFPSELSFSANDLKQVSGLSDAEFGGQLQFQATVTGNDGTVIVGTETFTTNLFNPGQRQAHTFNVNLVCPSDLAGTYNYSVTGMSTDGCCPNETTISGTLTLTDGGSVGTYIISDISAGLYVEWYDVYGITADTDMSATVSDACGIFSGSAGGPFGGTPTATGAVIDRENGIIEYRWSNGFGDFGEVRLERVQ